MYRLVATKHDYFALQVRRPLICRYTVTYKKVGNTVKAKILGRFQKLPYDEMLSLNFYVHLLFPPLPHLHIQYLSQQFPTLSTLNLNNSPRKSAGMQIYCKRSLIPI